MRNSKSKLKSGKYTLSFTVLTTLILILTAFLVQSSFGQATPYKIQNQTPLVAKVTPQNDSPLQISIIEVDNSDITSQNIVYSIKNVGNKPIRAYTLIGSEIVSTSYLIKLFQVDGLDKGEMSNIKEGQEVFLSVDYVEFADGTSWGNDSQGKSKEMASERAGRKEAIKQLKDIIKSGNRSALTNLFSQEVTNLTVPVLELNQTVDWQRGFQRGYRSVISILKRNKEEGIASFSKKLDEMELNH